MGATLGRTFPALFGDQAHLNPKLRPPSLLGVLFCLISTFCFICCLTSFRLQMINIWPCFALIILYGAMGTSEGSAWERSYPTVTFLVPIGIGTVLLPFYIGVKIYCHLYAPYLLATQGREYMDVPPSAKTAEYADAGILKFTEDATLDTSRSFGYKADDFTYCVAPVVSRNDAVHPTSAGPKVTFWAVGKDCCGNRREFECDGAGETEVRSSFTVRDVGYNFVTKRIVPRTSRPLYLAAVDAAKALHNLRSESDDEIILVRWAADPLDTLEVWSQRAKIACAVACIVYSVCVTMLWSFIHVWFCRDINKLVGMRGMGSQGKSKDRVSDPFSYGGGA